VTGSEPSIRTEDLTVSYRTRDGILKAVDRANVELARGKILAIVGESGCGKSTLALSLSRLLPEGVVTYSGEIYCNGTDLLSLSRDDVEEFRGTVIATTFQEPMTSLNPVYRIGEQIAEAIAVSRARKNAPYSPLSTKSKRQSITYAFGLNALLLLRGRSLYPRLSNEVHESLRQVRISEPPRVASLYPHELSGGMRQRAMIAMALAQTPQFLIADEITTALDVTTQSKILSLIKKIARELNMGVLLITHDLGVAAAVANNVAVMYSGRIVEEAPAKELFANPLHPYTIGLIESFPRGKKDEYELTAIPGIVPMLTELPRGCRFNPRCPKAFEKCRHSDPELISASTDHKVSCFLYEV
jgi:oligopeptide/dipeptide ABC transporter ATP-binding protein